MYEALPVAGEERRGLGGDGREGEVHRPEQRAMAAVGDARGQGSARGKRVAAI